MVEIDPSQHSSVAGQVGRARMYLAREVRLRAIRRVRWRRVGFTVSLVSCSVFATAGVRYDLIEHSVAPSSFESITYHFSIDKRNVRIDLGGHPESVIFKNGIYYQLDHTARSVVIQYGDAKKHGAEVIAQMAGELQGPGTETQEAKQALMREFTRGMTAAFDKELEPVPREFRITERFEVVEGRSVEFGMSLRAA